MKFLCHHRASITGVCIAILCKSRCPNPEVVFIFWALLNHVHYRLSRAIILFPWFKILKILSKTSKTCVLTFIVHSYNSLANEPLKSKFKTILSGLNAGRSHWNVSLPLTFLTTEVIGSLTRNGFHVLAATCGGTDTFSNCIQRTAKKTKKTAKKKKCIQCQQEFIYFISDL